MPSRRSDRAVAADAYQDSGAGANPNDSVSLATARSGAPSGNRSSTAKSGDRDILGARPEAFKQRITLRCLDAHRTPEMSHITSRMNSAARVGTARAPAREGGDFGKLRRQRQGHNEKTRRKVGVRVLPTFCLWPIRDIVANSAAVQRRGATAVAQPTLSGYPRTASSTSRRKSASLHLRCRCTLMRWVRDYDCNSIF